MSEMINVGCLHPHPRNNEFFDDMTGEKWDEFLESVRTSGVIEPIVVTPDGDGYTIVSGHQRTRACKELGKTEILCHIKDDYKSDDEILRDLIETNIKQRGSVGGSQLKLGRRIAELERIYGIKRGRPSEENSSNGANLSQKELADMLEVDLNTLKRAKTLASLPSEIQQMVEDGKISASTASRVIASLSPSEQEQLISSLDVTAKYTQKQIESQLSSIRGRLEDAERDNQALREDNDMLKDTCANVRRKYLELKEREPEVREVVPEDYEYLKTNADALQSKLNDAVLKIKRLEADAEQNKEDAEKHRALKKEIERLTTEKHSIALQIDASRELTALIRKIMQMIQEDLAPVKFSNAMDELGNNGGYIKAKLIGLLDTVDAWAQEVREAIEEKEIIDITERKEIVG